MSVKITGMDLRIDCGNVSTPNQGRVSRNNGVNNYGNVNISDERYVPNIALVISAARPSGTRTALGTAMI